MFNKNKICLIGLILVAVVLVSGCSQSTPSINVKSPANGSSVNGPDVKIELDTKGFSDGNVAVNLDDNNKTEYATNSTYTVKDLQLGVHTVTFSLQKDGENILQNGKAITASVTFTVKGAESVLGKPSKDQVDTKGLPTPPKLPASVKSR